MTHERPDTPPMPPPSLRFPAHAERELARHHITPEHVRQVAANAPALLHSEPDRAPDRRLMVGPDDGGRMLAVVLDHADVGGWVVVAGRPAERAEIVAYRRRREAR